MKADAVNPRELFEGKVLYEIPAFQRPYVWSEEDQWDPLWQDVKRVAEKVVAADGDRDRLERVGGHFLGAVVLKSKPAFAGDVTRHSLIDWSATNDNAATPVGCRAGGGRVTRL